MYNKSILIGRLTADPELKQTPAGVAVTAFTIAVNRRYQKDGERKADFISIVAWRQQAEFISKHFQKGSAIGIDGSIQTRNYEDKNGNRRTVTEVVADRVFFVEPASRKSERADSPDPNFTEMKFEDDDLPF